MDREEVIREIEEAFADVPYPGDDFIVAAPMNWEASDVRSDFLGKHWRDVVEPRFLREHKLHCFFSTAGFCFYLPAYLIGTVRFPEEGVHWSSELISALYLPLDWGNAWLKHWHQKTNALTAQQKHAIRLFLVSTRS